ncbi:thioredoxin-like protein [Cristinia sonorae]|uniref:Thioredoxin-like protein n=1 Tax=Cristinia sonorae TaxID=1940300 RepID=A0A8K0XQH6_9AGAR|nr:thioredoxin-like protein [Cristinia sonorae]
MFSAFKRSIPQISIFHNPSSPPSQTALRLLNASLSSPYPPNSKHPLKFNLEVIENQPPTADQFRTILSYTQSPSADHFISAHPSGAGSVGGGRSPEDVTKLAQKNPNALKWPIVVDWDGGRAAVGDLEGVKRILEELRKQRDGE